jgi:hypothetical protein
VRKLLLILAVAALTAVACGPWLRTGGPYSSTYLDFSVQLPDGWMRRNINDHLFLTRDGGLLQNILIERVNVADDLTHTKKKFARGMLAQEAAQVLLDNFRSDEQKQNFKVLSNAPARVDGHHGFKAVFTYRNEDGLPLKSVYYGFLEGEWFYGIRYTAAQRYYYKKDLKTFEAVVKSFHLGAAGGGKKA